MTKASGRDKRRNPRIAGPFNARWAGANKVPLCIHDLSVGGCMVMSSMANAPPDRLTLEIELVHNTWITVSAELLYQRPGVGFAVRFVDVPQAIALRLERLVTGLITNGSRAIV